VEVPSFRRSNDMIKGQHSSLIGLCDLLKPLTYHGNQILLPSLDSLGADREVNSVNKILYGALECREKDFKTLCRLKTTDSCWQ